MENKYIETVAIVVITAIKSQRSIEILVAQEYKAYKVYCYYEFSKARHDLFIRIFFICRLEHLKFL